MITPCVVLYPNFIVVNTQCIDSLTSSCIAGARFTNQTICSQKMFVISEYATVLVSHGMLILQVLHEIGPGNWDHAGSM